MTRASSSRVLEASSYAEDPIWRRWQVAHETAPESVRWTREMVDDRMKEAMRTTQRSVGRVGPKVFGNSMPAIVKDPLDLWFEQMAQDEERAKDQAARNRVKVASTIQQITRADDAIRWPWRYLSDQTGPLLIYNIWLRSIAYRSSFAKSIRAKGINYETAKRRRRHGGLIIATGLMLDRIEHGLALDETVGLSPLDGYRAAPEHREDEDDV